MPEQNAGNWPFTDCRYSTHRRRADIDQEKWLAAAREGQAGAILAQDATLRDCKRLLGELSAATERADALEGALRGLVQRCEALGWGNASDPLNAARKALLPSEGFAGLPEKYQPNSNKVLVESDKNSHEGGSVAPRSGGFHGEPAGATPAPTGTTPAPEGFEEWHRRECPDYEECLRYPEGSRHYNAPWTGGWGPRFEGRTCREVWSAEHPTPPEEMPPYPPGHICQMGEVEPVERKDCPLCKHPTPPEGRDLLEEAALLMESKGVDRDMDPGFDHPVGRALLKHIFKEYADEIRALRGRDGRG